MGLVNKNLSVVAYANGFTIWHYKTADKLDDLMKNYFTGNVADLMNVNDMFIINAGDQNAILFVKDIMDKNVKLG